MLENSMSTNWAVNNMNNLMDTVTIRLVTKPIYKAYYEIYYC